MLLMDDWSVHVVVEYDVLVVFFFVFLFYEIFALIMQGRQIAGKLIWVYTQLQKHWCNK